jgi:hypothetical protein
VLARWRTPARSRLAGMVYCDCAGVRVLKQERTWDQLGEQRRGNWFVVKWSGKDEGTQLGLERLFFWMGPGEGVYIQVFYV